MICLGIDTSNYTTSVAFYDQAQNTVIQNKKLLTVKKGEMGLRQADALFQHTVSLPLLLEELCEKTFLTPEVISVSYAPTDCEGSYMPCFLAGMNAAGCMASAFHVPLYRFSHQAGHIAAALYSSNRLDWLKTEFLAFHVSGGTTQAVLCKPEKEKIIQTALVSSSLDLKAGQVIDRVGKMLGLSFPAGAELDRLSLLSTKKFCVRPFMRDGRCSLSGLENQCQKMVNNGEQPQDVARYCIEYISSALSLMTESLIKQYGELPLLYSGGVMSNSLIRERFQKKYGAVFAAPGFSCDNAAGTAVLGAVKAQNEQQRKRTS